MLLLGFVSVMAMRLIMVFTMGLMPQDAYYYFYSTRPALSYFDHPPGVAIHLWLFTKILGTHPWSLKLANFIVMCGTLAAYYYLARRFLSTSRSLWALCIFGATLVFTDVCIVTTPDVPLLLFWMLALIAIHHALDSRQILPWILAGLLSGLAFDAKYTAFYLPVALAALIYVSRKSHGHQIRFYPGYLIGFLIAVSPVIIWNAQHDMTSIQFQTGERFSAILEFKFRPQYFAGTLGHLLLMLLPVLGVALIRIGWKYTRRIVAGHLPNRDTVFLLMFGLPMIAGFVLISWVYWVKINWMLPAYITMSILLIRYLSTRHLYWQQIAAVVANALLLIQIVFYPVPVQSDDTYWGWDQLSSEVRALHTQFPDHFLFASDGYKTTAVLNFFLDTKVYAGNVIGKRALQYSIADRDLTQLEGHSALFFDSQNVMSRFDEAYVPPPELAIYFSGVRVLGEIVLHDKFDRVLRKFAVVECTNYHQGANIQQVLKPQ